MAEAEKTIKKEKYFYGKGARKSSVAQVYLSPKGKGVFTVNGIEYQKYFVLPLWQQIFCSPLKTANHEKDIDLNVKVAGGGIVSQAGACRHGITRALEKMDPELRKALKAEGFLTRDPRVKERKKPGLKRARRAPQWSKR